MGFVNFNDESLPIGKRKQAYIKFAVSKGTEIIQAKKQANKKFGFEKKQGLFAIVRDYGRMGQRSYTGISEIFQGYDLRKYENYKWAEIDNECERIKIEKEYKNKKWDVIYVNLSS